jgi:murein hydrolase activator
MIRSRGRTFDRLDSERPSWRLAGLLGFIVFAGVTGQVAQVQAQTPAPGKIELKNSLTEKQSELKRTAEQEKTLQADLETIRQQRAKLNTRLIETGDLIRKSEEQMTAIEARLGELEAQEALLRGSLEKQHDSIADLLAALQRMGRNPPPVIITERKDALKMVRSAMQIAAVFPDMRERATTLAGQLNDLVRVMSDIRSEGDRLKSETESLNTMRTKLAALLEEKKQKITDHQSELKKVRLAAADISKSVNDLNELISKLDTTVKRNTTLQAYDEKLKRQEAEETAARSGAQPGPGGGSGSNSGPLIVRGPNSNGDGTPSGLGRSGSETVVAAVRPTVKPASPNVIELAPASGSLIPGKADRIEPSIPFKDARGRLPLPAHGKRILNFAQKTHYGGKSKGIVLETRSFGQVISPSDGWVLYAGKFRSYGQLLIIDAGGGYHVLLAGLSRIDVEPGQFVLAAEPVGAMGGGAKASGKPQPANADAPVLYVEFRKNGKPIDPDPWWADGRLRVQG